MKLWRRLKLGAAWFAAALLLLMSVAVAIGFRAFGQSASGARLQRMQRSPQWQDGHFVNPEPLINDWLGSLTGAFHISPVATPAGKIQSVRLDPKTLRTPPTTGLRVTWLGHASTLVEIDGARVLTDPMWSERSSPIPFVGPRRYYAPPIALSDLPRIHAVVISHDHYDHLDYRTLVAMKDWPTTFVVPLGVGAHLAYWGIDESKIVELDWWEKARVGPIDIVCTPARHASGRTLFDKDANLWAGYALIGAKHRVFFSGDTGLFSAMKDIGERLGPFDVTMIEIGQYHAAWPDWHIGPERAVEAHGLLRGRVFLPVHWALLTLAYHGWSEPMERVLAAAQKRDVTVLTPRPGEAVEPEGPMRPARWWPTLPWQTAEESPLVSVGALKPR